MKDVLTTGEVAKYCGVNFRTVIRWIEKGYIDAYKLPGRGDNRVPVAALIDFLEKNKMPVPDSLSTTVDRIAPIQENSNKQNQTKLRILVVEDEALMAKSIARTIKREGYDVKIASNGFEAGIQLASYQPQLITLDLQMPGMNGREVLEALRANPDYQNIKVLVVSAATKVKMLEVMALGVDDVLEKPFKSEELRDKLHRLINAKA